MTHRKVIFLVAHRILPFFIKKNVSQIKRRKKGRKVKGSRKKSSQKTGKNFNKFQVGGGERFSGWPSWIKNTLSVVAIMYTPAACGFLMVRKGYVGVKLDRMRLKQLYCWFMIIWIIVFINCQYFLFIFKIIDRANRGKGSVTPLSPPLFQPFLSLTLFPTPSPFPLLA